MGGKKERAERRGEERGGERRDNREGEGIKDPSNFINYVFFSVYCLLAISKRFGLPELLQSACKIVIATANNVQTTLASLLPRLTDKRLCVFGTGRYNCEGVPCFLRHPGVYHV